MIRKVRSDDEFHSFLQEALEMNRLMVVRFFSDSAIERKARKDYSSFQAEFRGIYYVDVDTDACPMAKDEFNVVSTPTFILFVRGRKFTSLCGYNFSGLRELVDTENFYRQIGKGAIEAAPFSEEVINVDEDEDDLSFLPELLDMGFDGQLCAEATRRFARIEPAIEWILNQPNKKPKT